LGVEFDVDVRTQTGRICHARSFLNIQSQIADISEVVFDTEFQPSTRFSERQEQIECAPCICSILPSASC